jgi:secreted trypsin-like serine protease
MIRIHSVFLAVLILITAQLSTGYKILKRNGYESRIVGGTPVTTGEYPFIGGVVSDKYGQFCGGSLVDSRFLLTAAHCFDDYDLVPKL